MIRLSTVATATAVLTVASVMAPAAYSAPVLFWSSGGADTVLQHAFCTATAGGTCNGSGTAASTNANNTTTALTAVNITSLPGPWVDNFSVLDGLNAASRWISWGQTGAGSNIAPNNNSANYLETIFEEDTTFSVGTGEIGSLSTKVFADDTARIELWRNGSFLTTLKDYSASDPSGLDNACAGSSIGCEFDEGYLASIANLGEGSYKLRVFARQIGGNGHGAIWGGIFDVTAVPLPAAGVLFASALAGLAWMRRRDGGEPVALAA